MALDYYEDGVDRILRLMRDTLGDKYTYFNGELLNPTEAALPCVMVTQETANISSGPTGYDAVNETVTIIVALNKKDDIGATDTTELTDYRIRKIVAGQDATTGQYLPQTVMYAVRKHITANSDTLQSTVSIEYTPNLRGGESGIQTQEAYITINMERYISVPSRD